VGLLQNGLEKWLHKSSRPALAYELSHPSPDRGEHLLYLSVVWRTRGAEGERPGRRPDEHPVEDQRSRGLPLELQVGGRKRGREPFFLILSVDASALRTRLKRFGMTLRIKSPDHPNT
jgi:hypothetical protein